MVVRQTNMKMADMRREAERKERDWNTRLNSLSSEYEEKLRDTQQDRQTAMKELSLDLK